MDLNFETAKPVPILKAAIEYATMGWPVLPVHSIQQNGACTCGNTDCSHSAKHPKTKNGVHDATTDESRIRKFSHWENSNIGIATGKIAGLFVLDVDEKNGGKFSLIELEKQHGKLPPTPTVNTGGGGFHIYFKYPNIGVIKNKVNLREGIDVRGDGGYAVAPLSKHKSGISYQWDGIYNPQDMELADAPQWLLDLIMEPAAISQPVVNLAAPIEQGARNNSLFRIAASYRGKGLSAEDIKILLTAKNKTHCNPTLPESEIQSIAKSVGKYSIEQVNSENWLPVEVLPPLALEAPQLFDALIPELFRPFTLDASERMQVQPEMIAVPLLITTSSMLGTRILIQPKKLDDWRVPPNLWGGIVAPSSAMKSPSMKIALKPLYKLEEQTAKDFKTEMQGYLQRKAANPKQIESIPIRHRRIINDATPEKTGMLLQENPNGLLLFRDELMGLLLTLEKPGYEGFRQLLLEAFDGDGKYVTDRICRDTVDIPQLCLSILGGIQPDKFSAYFAKLLKSGSSDDGFLPRFQVLVYPQCSPEYENIDRLPNLKAREEVDNFFKILDEFDFKTAGFEHDNDRIFTRFDEEAQELSTEWLNQRERLLRSGKIGSSLFEAFLAKQKKTMSAFALILHSIDFCSGKQEKTKVSLQSIQTAISLCNFFEAHTRKIYNHAVRADIVEAHEISKRIRDGQVTDGMTVRELVRMRGGDKYTAELVDSALTILEKHHWLRIVTLPSTGGRPSQVVYLNPELLPK